MDYQFQQSTKTTVVSFKQFMIADSNNSNMTV